MLRRVLMALLVLCLALPAAALPVAHEHTAPAMPAHEHHAAAHAMNGHDQRQPTDERHSPPVAPAHDCIGCVADSGGIAAMPPVVEWRGLAPRPALAASGIGHLRDPETPPPRA
ncbi:hypothetical protein H7F51_04325 [Novosphingobium flavum]|uniref:DUF2946 domain-containing protein n=1 Tax=Novosphingobium flavum TaxID=1778672 RepID=A0A7X1FQN0_9SPHN|nr:hypothetical protein [Novosphingobium flavum]MBC2664742.1 hypothetical protein [Novosphingobium flavum]